MQCRDSTNLQESLFYFIFTIFFSRENTSQSLALCFLNLQTGFDRLPSLFSLLVFVTTAACLSPLEERTYSDTDACFF